MIFVDTWAWLALAHVRDPYHALATAQHRKMLHQRRRYVTTDYVLSETITILFGRLDFDQSRRFIESVFHACDNRAYVLVHLSPDLFHRAWQLRLRYHDKPGFSFVDLTSAAVMQELGISEIFSGDAHFAQMGLGFRLLPEPTT